MTYQFDWSHEQVELEDVLQTVKVAHFRMAYSRQMFVVAYPRESQEMVWMHTTAPWPFLEAYLRD